MLYRKELGLGEESYLIYFISMTVSLFNLPWQEFLDCDCYHREKSMVFQVTIAIEWMVWKQPLVSMVFPMVFVYQPLVPMVFWLATIGLDGFAMVFGLATIGLDGFSMVANHWSNDGMVTIHRYGLPCQDNSVQILWSSNRPSVQELWTIWTTMDHVDHAAHIHHLVWWFKKRMITAKGLQ